MQIETTIKYHYTLTEWIKLKGPTIPSVDKEVKELELLHTAGGNIK